MEYERFAPLVTPNTEVMARVAAALVGASDAEDAAQEALVRAWRAWPSLRDAHATRAWLMQITVNVCRSWLRKRGPYSSLDDLPGDQPPDYALSAALEQPSPGSGDHVAALDLRRALRSLDDDMRMVVALRFYAGMDSTEIGDLLGVSPATIRGRLRRALLALRQALGASDPRGRRAAPSPMTSSTTSRKDA
ncbi:MAG TPA: sigma-70 family RNA polymerase sigma factor [Ktedonobacterales bacterium]|jgi:RNA polymerase sigma-70 factor (ECF subfamily)|nr:sigma-70 family RNA polymerase sigma factor [Ktedonobacterales bacterium]